MSFFVSRLPIAFAAIVAATLTADTARAEIHSYYVGVDGQATLTTGTYAGLENPNFNRLTFLYAHYYEPGSESSNHYHSKATRVYTGPNLGTDTAVVQSTSNYVPEGTNLPLQLQSGSGVYAGKLVTVPHSIGGVENHFSHLTLANTKSLDGFAAGTGENYLFNASGGRWIAAFDAADVYWELVSLTPGLHVGDADTLDIASLAGDDVPVGKGSELFQFTPVLWTDASAAAGTYEASFRLIDESGTFGSSGDVRFITSVPEPASLAALGLGAVALLRRSRRA